MHTWDDERRAVMHPTDLRVATGRAQRHGLVTIPLVRGSSTRTPLQNVLICVLSGAVVACSGDDAIPVETAFEDEEGFACVDPPEPPEDHEPPPYVPHPTIGTLTQGFLTHDGAQVSFHHDELPTTWIASLLVDFGHPEDDETTDGRDHADAHAYGHDLRIITNETPVEERYPADTLVLDAGRLSLDVVELAVRLQLHDAPGTAPSAALLGFELITHAGVPVAGQNAPNQGFQVPLTCPEQALLNFGPLPNDMPPIKLPIIRPSCQQSAKCIRVAETWIRGHHHAWRANQIIEGLSSMAPGTRHQLWSNAGADKNGEALGAPDGSHPTSPHYWYGAFTDDRWQRIKMAQEKLWKVYRTARTADGAIAIRIRCPTVDGDANSVGDPGNICFTSVANPAAHHFSKGWVNICPNGFALGSDGFLKILLHEPMHHVFATGVALRDLWTHWHGSTCAASPRTEFMYGVGRIRELATYLNSQGQGCGHRNISPKTIDAHALFVREIGTRVRSGQMWWWPHIQASPQPPTCTGDPGCLCDETPTGGPAVAPNGDYSPNHHCTDHDGVATCVKTAVTAGAIVGICTRCEDERGPGCECNKLHMPCDVGECFGDDTYGYAAGWGECYKAPPPPWACLADCQRLFNDTGAWCYFNPPAGQARCMDSECDEPTAYNCAIQNQICRDGACIGLECGPDVTCADLGYPAYYHCSASFKCEHPWG
jgi:hypothetical protein